MALRQLSLENVRCLTAADLELCAGHNLIVGENGSGKTSLLEAIFLLGRGRSFRTRNSERLIRHGEPFLRVVGRVSHGSLEGAPDRVLGLEVTRTAGTRARVDARDALSLAELSTCFPVQVIDPGIHKLLEEGGHRRRRWLDWAVFHVEHSFIDSWARYTRALRQRNAALKTQPAIAWTWDPELVRLGEQVAASRERVFRELEPTWRAQVASLTGLEVQMSYQKGWSQELGLEAALAGSRSRDGLRQMTHSGPHRADIVVRHAGRNARETLSRGQQKLVAAAMVLAQLRYLRERLGRLPTLLLDDPAAELDQRFLARFIAEVRSFETQLVITALHVDSAPFGTPECLFHVEQGRVRPV